MAKKERPCPLQKPTFGMLRREIIGVGPEKHKKYLNPSWGQNAVSQTYSVYYMVLLGFKQLLSVRGVSLMLAVYCLSNDTILDHVHCNCSKSD
jgi:hypothetical protein